MQMDLAFTKMHKTPKKIPSNRYAFGLCILHSYAFGGGNLAYMPKESGYANRDHGILGSTSRAFFFPSRGFPSRRHHFARLEKHRASSFASFARAFGRSSAQ